MQATNSAIQSCLIVDDHKGVRDLLRDLLTERFEQISESTNGSDAVSFCMKQPPEIVIMDIEMPGTDGITATRAIVRSHPESKVVVLTHHNSPRIKRAALEAGAIAFIPKADVGQLAELLDSLEDSPF
ncbi:MAG: response regulator transcription factor, partial [Planctomycetota bacterium]